MSGTQLQTQQDKINAITAKRIGLPFDVYRASSMLTPIAAGNKIITAFLASFTVSKDTLNYLSYNKPQVPMWTAILDSSQVHIGDWLVGAQGTFFIADKQALQPIPAIQCSCIISIVRPGYTTSGPAEQTETAIATNLPVFGYTARDRGRLPAGFPGSSETDAAMPSMQYYINSRTIGAIQKNDVIVDEVGLRWIIDTPNRTSFGFIVEARIEKP